VIISDDLKEFLDGYAWQVADLLGDEGDAPYRLLGDWIDQDLPFEAFEYESAEQAESIGVCVGAIIGAAKALNMPVDSLLRDAGIIPREGAGETMPGRSR
jgi:hypothetical protein